MDSLLREAIAEAKLIKETAYANAKAALEEAFTPQIKELLSKKLRAEAEDGEEAADFHPEDETGSAEEEGEEHIKDEFEDENPTEPVEEGDEFADEDPSKNKVGVNPFHPHTSEDTEVSADEFGLENEPAGEEDLDEIFEKLREDLEGSSDEDNDGEEHEFSEPEEHRAEEESPAEEEAEEEFSTEEPYDDEDEINLDFDDDDETTPEAPEESPAPEPTPETDAAEEAPAEEEIPSEEPESKHVEDEGIPSTYMGLDTDAQSDAAGHQDPAGRNKKDLTNMEATPASEFTDEDEDDEEIGGVEPFGKKTSPRPEGEEGDDDEDLDIEEVLREYEMESEDGEEPMDADHEELTKKLHQTEADLREHRKVIKYLRSKLNEVNLLNSKLLYTNKLFKENSLNMNQKIQVVEAFDAASSVKEAKSVYKTLFEVFAGIKAKKTKRAERIVEGLASKPTASTKPSEQIISEGNNVANRFQVLAGLRKRSI